MVDNGNWLKSKGEEMDVEKGDEEEKRKGEIVWTFPD